MTKYVAFMRGINVGGNKIVPMKELQSLLEKNGFGHVKTLLASGNVVFDSNKTKIAYLPSILKKYFGFEINTLVLPASDIDKIVADEPFKGIKVTPKTRLYVTFFMDEPKGELEIPYESPDKSFRIFRITENAIFSVLDLAKSPTPKAMEILEKSFGKSLTTRNFNTIEKISALSASDSNRKA